jgi:hypothetical protein
MVYVMPKYYLIPITYWCFRYWSIIAIILRIRNKKRNTRRKYIQISLQFPYLTGSRCDEDEISLGRFRWRGSHSKKERFSAIVKSRVVLFDFLVVILYTEAFKTRMYKHLPKLNYYFSLVLWREGSL